MPDASTATATAGIAPAAVPARRSAWKVVVLASLGGGLEIYDFIIYGVFALQIGTQFFPKSDPFVALLSAFAVFALGYVSRPLGAGVLGSLGDRLGRRPMFLLSVMVMSACTIAVGLLPTYASIGILAPLLLVLLRLTQGFFLAGELACSITYVVEEIPGKASLVIGMVVFCLHSGVVLATLVSLAVHTYLPAKEVLAYGWRIAFVLGGLTGLLSYWLRTSLEESQEYAALKGQVSRRPLRQVLAEMPLPVLAGIGVSSILNVGNSMLFVLLPAYLTRVLHDPVHDVGLAQAAALAAMAPAILLVGWLGQRIAPRRLHALGSLLMLLGGYPLYKGLVSHAISPMQAYLMLGMTNVLISATYSYLLADLFPTRLRFSGVALSLNMATVVFTAITPLLVTALIHATGDRAAPGLYLSLIALLGLASGLLARPLSGRIANAAQSPAIAATR